MIMRPLKYSMDNIEYSMIESRLIWSIWKMSDMLEIVLYSAIALVAGLFVAQFINEKFRK